MNGGSVEPEGRGINLVVMLIIALATFLIPVVQRWLRQRAERGGAAPWKGEDVEDAFDPYPELRSDEPETREEEAPHSLVEEDVEESEPAKPPSREAKTPDVEPLLKPAGPTTRRLDHSLEVRVFAHRRWSPGAKLIIAKELLERPKCFRRIP
jgi:hypothetical protein